MPNLDIGSTPSADYSDIQALAGITGIISDASIDADPRFVAPVAPSSAPSFASNYRLKGDSAAIDVDSDALNTLPIDLGGQPRIQGAAIDMGAYEATPAPHLAIHKSTDTATAIVGDTITPTLQD